MVGIEGNNVAVKEKVLGDPMWYVVVVVDVVVGAVVADVVWCVGWAVAIVVVGIAGQKVIDKLCVCMKKWGGRARLWLYAAEECLLGPC